MISGKACRVLVVEDQDDDYLMTSRLLGRFAANAEIYRARDGKDALTYLQTVDAHHLPHLILTDLHMPRIDGVELCETLRRLERTRAVPVILLRTSDEPGDVRRAYEAGVSAYVIKAIDYDEFTESMTALCDFYFRFVQYPGERPVCV